MEPFTKGLCALALAGLLLRLAWVISVWDMGFGTNTDQAGYVLIARNIAEFEPEVGLVFSPLYPHVLGAVIKLLSLTGLDFLPLRGVVGAIQAVISAGVIVMIGHLARRRIGASAGLFAAAVLTLWPDQIMAPGTLLTERLSTPLAIAALAVLLWDENRISRRSVIAAGVLLGLVSLTRFALAPLLPFGALIVISKGDSWKHRLRMAAGFAASSLIVIAPWLGYTFVITGEPLVFSAGGGFNLCLGNNDYATGTWSIEAVEKVCPWPAGRFEQVEMDAQMRGEALRWIADNPDRQWGLVQARFHAMFDQDTGSQAWYPTYLKWEGPVSEDLVRHVANTWWRYIAPLSLLGAVVIRGRLRWELAGYAVASLALPLISIAEMRFKDAVVPVMAIACGAVLGWVVDRVRSNEPFHARVEVFLLPENQWCGGDPLRDAPASSSPVSDGGE
jgi:hypothetical protein